MTVIQDLSPTQVARFVEQIHAVPGVDLSVNPVRTYPNGDMAFHTLGYLRRDDDPDAADDVPFRFRYRLPDYVGVDGLEGVYDDLLRGNAGAKTIRVNNISYRTSEEVWEWPESGYDMVLSLDRDIQLAAEAALQANGPETRGAVVVMDPRTGDLLSLVSLPGFDSNKSIRLKKCTIRVIFGIQNCIPTTSWTIPRRRATTISSVHSSDQATPISSTTR
jgi:penicillin-binding protein 2